MDVSPNLSFVDIGALSAFLISIGSYHQDLVFIPQSKLQDGTMLLYHYTDLSGLIGVVEKHDLWLTHSRYSNDDEEMTHGLSVVKGVMEAAVKDGTYDSTYLTELTRLTSEPEGVYICCFCEKDNLLSQWRGYGANGAGVSLQFAAKQFADVAGPDNSHGLLRFWKVFYGQPTQKQIVETAISNYAPALNPGKTVAELARQAADAIRFFIPTFKNSDFAEENEWRLLFTPAPNATVKPHFRVGRSMLMPYYSLRELIGVGLPTLPIQKVTVGPGAHKRINAASVKALLEQNGYPGIVEISDTPYRG
jgi:hypothetical protein